MSYDVPTRVFTLYPKSTVYQATHAHVLRAKSTNFPANNKVEVAFNAIGTAPCVHTSYNADTKLIKLPSDQEKYNIGTDGDKVLPFSFDTQGPSCSGSYFKEYTVVVEKSSVV